MARRVTLEKSVDLLNTFKRKAEARLLLVLSQEWLKDSNRYVYKDQGFLQDSAQAHSDFKKGVIRWRTPYARRRFYEGGNAGDGNRKARPRWSEHSKSENIQKYKRIQTKIMKQVKMEVYGL